ncbi:hypothetical protein P9112_012096 [Eukaryota sp. TZLM1-RC]
MSYIPAVNTGLSLGLIIVIGYVLGATKRIKSHFYTGLNQYVFNLALPSAVCMQIWGASLDQWGDMVWRFINVWIVFRLTMLTLSSIFARFKKQHLGNVCVHWLGTTWASTILIGGPFLKALYGQPQWGLFAAVSSWICQLPPMLIMFELYKVQRDYSIEVDEKKKLEKEKVVETKSDSEEETKEIENTNDNDDNNDGVQPEVSSQSNEEGSPEKEVSIEVADEATSLLPEFIPFKVALRKVSYKKILFKILTNPVIIALVLGWSLNLLNIDRPGINDQGSDDTDPLFWIMQFLQTVGPTATPVAMFAIGMFAASKGSVKKIVSCGWKKLAIYLCIKMLVTPFIIMPVVALFGLTGVPARAAVHVVATPISMASFALTTQYGIGNDLMSAMITFGAIIIMPVIVFFEFFMDTFNIFTLP